MNQPARKTPAWPSLAVAWLTPRRLPAQAVIFAFCLWGVFAVDFSTAGFFDRAGNIKFQDFLPFYVSAQLIAQGRAGELYDLRAAANEIEAIVHHASGPQQTRILLPNLYGPQVGLVFAPLARLPFWTAAWLWVVLSMLIFSACILVLWKACLSLRPHAGLVAISAIAYPPLWHFFLRGQISVVALACFTGGFLALRARRTWLAGIALGFLIFKPQFLMAVPLVLLLGRAWKVLAGLVVSAAAQLAFARLYFGAAVMHAYFDTMWHMSRWIGAAELNLAPIQMHSLRSFWTLVIPWPHAALAIYILSSVFVVAMTAAVWKSSSPLALRFSALTLAAVLVNAHLFVYDLLVLAPVLLLLVDWTLANPQNPHSNALQLLCYLAFVLPLFGPLSRWTHVQLSVPVFVALLWIFWRQSANLAATPGHKLASLDSRVV